MRGSSSSMEEDTLSSSSTEMLPSSESSSEPLSSLSEVAELVSQCKQRVLETSEGSSERRELVKQLIRLRIREFELRQRDANNNSGSGDDVIELRGHMMMSGQGVSTVSSGRLWCDVCTCAIWQYLQSYKTCMYCNLIVHVSCLRLVRRECVMLKVHTNPTLIMTICPEVGLDNLNYKCSECQAQLVADQFRLCDYTGLSFCKLCHWNALKVIPARIVRNWDFAERPISQAAKQYLELMNNKPVMQIRRENDKLFALVPELNVIQDQRERLMQMKRYLIVCRLASEQRLLLNLQPRQHFVDSAEFYSIQDLCDVHNGSLSLFMDRIMTLFSEHITRYCVLCRAKGYICEICNDSSQLLFPFEDTVLSCIECETVFHKECFKRLKYECPKCERRKSRHVN